MGKYAEIIDRLEKATGPDRNIDVFAWTLIIGIKPRHTFFAGRDEHVEKITASIDASVALVEKMLPGWAHGYDKGQKTCIGFVDRHDFNDRITGARFTATGASAPIAILIALFKALEAKESGDV